MRSSETDFSQCPCLSALAVLKGYLGIENKRPGVVALEDEALRLRRSSPPPRPDGRTGPLPNGGMVASTMV
jgi:hypothetical protein